MCRYVYLHTPHNLWLRTVGVQVFPRYEILDSLVDGFHNFFGRHLGNLCTNRPDSEPGTWLRGTQLPAQVFATFQRPFGDVSQTLK